MESTLNGRAPMVGQAVPQDHRPGPLEALALAERKAVEQMSEAARRIDALAAGHVEAAKRRLADSLAGLKERLKLARGFLETACTLAMHELESFAAEVAGDCSRAADVPAPRAEPPPPAVRAEILDALANDPRPSPATPAPAPEDDGEGSDDADPFLPRIPDDCPVHPAEGPIRAGEPAATKEEAGAFGAAERAVIGELNRAEDGPPEDEAGQDDDFSREGDGDLLRAARTAAKPGKANGRKRRVR